MKKWIVIAVVIIAALFLYTTFKGSYNRMVQLNNQVKSQWAQVENVYQRRADLIPNLVNTVKGYADFEQETLTQVTEARARASQTTINPENLDPQNLEQFQAAQNQLNSALSRLLVVVERYPELKANQNFLELQAQLEGAENRITVERRKYNDEVREYNTYLEEFPRNFLAGLYGFEDKPYFEAREGADVVPQVQF